MYTYINMEFVLSGIVARFAVFFSSSADEDEGSEKTLSDGVLDGLSDVTEDDEDLVSPVSEDEDKDYMDTNWEKEYEE